jgi:predicted oxidoreductase
MNLSQGLRGVAYGCWRFAANSTGDADRLIRTALDAGITAIDTADIYGLDAPSGFGGAEVVLGHVLKADPSLRDRFVLLTKGGIDAKRPYNSSRQYLMDALDASLSRLQVERIDLYQIHRPDLTISMKDLATTLDAMIESGKVGAVGVSNFTTAQTRALAAHLKAPLQTLQPEFSPLHQQPITDGTLDLADEISATVLAWSPLGGGRLFSDDGPVQKVINRIARAQGLAPTQVALAFTRTVGAHVVPIIGTQKPARIVEAAKAAELVLDGRDFYDIIEAYRGKSMP